MDSLHKAAGNRHLGEHVMKLDPVIASICAGWPKLVDTSRAQGLGLPIENTLEEIVEQYMEDYLTEPAS